ncbi:MAG: decaprenyl-phosphate phosphoribosyltransferase [Candidatus Nanopelagicales bacterium]|nr:decaprenyl-phosphate phosphoribosyltransferase [Candidatus Nanopelagicales bacterium]
MLNATRNGRSFPVALVAAVRPRQWLKNVLVFAAPLAAGSLFERSVIVPTLGAFIAFCLISSSTYLINDIRDIADDRNHPTKCNRPIAAGDLKPSVAAICSVALALAALALSWWIRPDLAGVVAVYFVFTLSYSLFLKHEPVIELALLAMGFLLRAIAGGVASNLPISQWFLIVAGFGSLFMAAGKRFSELDRALSASADVGAPKRRSLDGYSLGYLRFVWGVAAAITIVAYCLWAFEVGQAPSTLPWAQWSVLPFVLAILRYGVVIDRGQAEAPEDAVLHDKALVVIGGIWLVLFGLGALGV